MTSQKKKNTTQQHECGKILLGLCLSIFSITLTFLCIEAAIRVIGFASPETASWSDRPKFYYKPESAKTMQDYSYTKQKPEESFRISVVGDSFTFAPYMQFNDTFVKKLELMLNLNTEVEPVEVLNMGVPAYSSHHEVDVVKRAVRSKSDLILLQITLNDPELKPYVPTGLREGQPDRFGDLTPTPFQEKLFRYWKTAEFVARRVHNTDTHRAYRDYFFELYKEDSQTFREFEKAIAKMAAITKRRDIPFVATIFPLFGTPLDSRYPFLPLHEIVHKLLDRNEIPWIDLYDIYKDIPTDRLLVIPGVDRHPNEIAHRMAAEEIYLWLSQKNFIPERFIANNLYTQRIGTINQTRYRLQADIPNR